ncbi:MAG: hypothetical protein PHX20_00495 [Candidatus Omnitrophica bacterium]|nr:hypothetical protein [Candidatus Omnitrophota bacterium]MDD5436014.1 hypothetical protein [Candidatus Omnitrophota bacterium]
MIAGRILPKLFKEESYRIFMFAILVSLAWHLFWLSTISIASRPEGASSVKFSKVSFLGPLLGNSTMELQARPKERTLLEKRYADAVNRLSGNPIPELGLFADRYESGNDAYHLRDERLTASIEDALIGERFEPSYREE